MDDYTQSEKNLTTNCTNEHESGLYFLLKRGPTERGHYRRPGVHERSGKIRWFGSEKDVESVGGVAVKLRISDINLRNLSIAIISVVIKLEADGGKLRQIESVFRVSVLVTLEIR